MAGKIQLTPQELLVQSQEMLSLCKDFEASFKKNESILNMVNQNWSSNLANNFLGKISSAQKANSNILEMLAKGASLAETSANTYENVDSLLQKNITGTIDLKGSVSKLTSLFSWMMPDKKEKEVSGYVGDASADTEWSLKSSGKKTVIKRERIDDNDPFYYEVNYQDEVDENYTKFYDPKATILEGKAEAKAEASILGGTYAKDGTTLSGTVGYAEAHAEAAAGLYVIGADGTKIFSPGVKAEVGASVSALHGSWDQQWLGNENLGVNTHAEATVGKVEAKAGVNAQLFDENGYPKVQVSGELKAEAIAAEAKGSVGVNILGGEAKVTGGVNFGIGAHAEVGYKDGVIKCDIGASLGLGVDVGFEVDVGGMVENVAKKGKEIAKFAEDSVDAIADGAKALWNKFF